MDFEVFRAMYAARFRPLTENDGLSEWKAFSDTITSDYVIRKAMENIAGEIAQIKANNPIAVVSNPKLAQIKNAFFAVIRENNERKIKEDANTECPYCHGSYLVECAVGDGNKILVPEESCILSDFKGMMVFPCPICRGRDYLDRERLNNAKKGYRKTNETNDEFFQRFKDFDDWEYSRIKKQD